MTAQDKIAQAIQRHIQDEKDQKEEAARRAKEYAEQHRAQEEMASKKSKERTERLKTVTDLVINSVKKLADDIISAGYVSANIAEPESLTIRIQHNTNTLHEYRELARLDIVRTERDVRHKRRLIISFLWTDVQDNVDPDRRAISVRYAIAQINCDNKAMRSRPESYTKGPVAVDVATTWDGMKQNTLIGFSLLDDQKLRDAVASIIETTRGSE